MEDCVFCKIVDKKISSKIVFENEYVMAFYDIAPVAPVHILVIPKKHITSLNDVNIENMNYINECMLSIKEIAKSVGIYNNGYRVITNIGKDGGQAVNHLHFHILGGKKLNQDII